MDLIHQTYDKALKNLDDNSNIIQSELLNFKLQVNPYLYTNMDGEVYVYYVVSLCSLYTDIDMYTCLVLNPKIGYR